MAKTKILWITIIVLILIISALTFNKHNKYQNVQEYVSTAYCDDNSLIYAYPYKSDSQFLSESTGLYMNYLLLVNDAQAFDEQVKNIKEQFIVQNNKNYFILWTLDENTNVNALIDDVRIINSLIQGAKKFNKQEYKELAELLCSTLEQKQITEGIYTDFIDWKINKTSSRITLSYLTSDFFNTLKNTEKTKELLFNTNNQLVFFPEYYDLSQSEYKYAQEVHMVDQLLIAINRQELNISSPTFQKWITSEWKSKNKIKGQYSRDTLKPTVDYESLAVYAYVYKYFKLTNQNDLANQVKKRAKTIAEHGGLKNAHFFDYILYEQMLKSS